MPKVLVVGLVHPSGLGDLLQYYVACELIKRHLSDVDVTLAVPGHAHKLLNEIKGVNLMPSLSEITSLRHIFRGLAGRRQVNSGSNHVSHHSNENLENFKCLLSLLTDKYYESSFSISYLRPTFAKTWFRSKFDAVAIGGHTIEASAFFDYLINYSVQRALNKGFTVTFPISVSSMGIETHKSKEFLLRYALRHLDLIFVRGPYSHRTLSRYIDKRRIVMAPDSGFGVRLLHGSAKVYREGNVRVAIIPRKDYFFFYRKYELYKHYLGNLTRLIRWLTQHFEAEIYVVPQTLHDELHQGLDDESCIGDLLKELKGNQVDKQVRIFHPDSIREAYELYSSMDLVITSRMHGGIMAMSSGVPILFLLPRNDVKVHDVLSSLRLNPEEFLVDIFNVNEFTFKDLADKIRILLDNNSMYKKIVARSVEASLPMVELPAKILAKSLR